MHITIVCAFTPEETSETATMNNAKGHTSTGD